MPLVSVLSLKGGVGKTTTAIYFAECAQQLGQSPVLVDGDSEQSALRWASYGELSFPVVPLERAMSQQLADLGRQAGAVIVDSPPNQRDLLKSIASLSDHVVVPTLPTGLDLDRLKPTLQILRNVDARRPGGLDAAILLNRWSRRERLSREAVEAMGDLPLLKARVRDLARYRQAFGGAPQRTSEFMSAWREVTDG